MRYFLPLLFMTISITAFSQPSILQWQKTFGGSADEYAQCIRVTKDGGYIFTGPSDSNDSEVTGNHGLTDYWVVKTDDTGHIQWQTSLGGGGDEVSHSIQQTEDLGYIVIGGTSTNPPSGDISCTVMEWDYWMVKLSPSGAIVWKSCFGGSNYNVAWSVQQTTDSGYIATGTSYSTDGDVTGNHGSGDFWVIKVSSTGSLLWEKSLGGSGPDQAKSIQQTTDGGYIVAGSSSSNDGQVTGNHGGSDYWAVKLDDTGAIQWERSYGGSGTEVCYNVQQTIDGGYIIGGASNSIDGQVTGNHGGDDYWVVKIDDTGAIQWENSYGGAGDEICYSIQQTTDSGYVVAGSTDSASGQVKTAHGGNDYWIVKLNTWGELSGERTLGGSGTEIASSVQQTTDGGYIIAGQTSSDDGDITHNFGGQDFWVVKLSACLLDSPIIISSGDTLGTAITYDTYQWLLNGIAITGATSATYAATVNGNYEVIVTTTGSCSDTSAVKNISGLAVSNLHNGSVTMEPNPTTGIINITGAGQVNAHVYNTAGQLMQQSANTRTISIASLPPGLYFIYLSDINGNIISRDKIIKQ